MDASLDWGHELIDMPSLISVHQEKHTLYQSSSTYRRLERGYVSLAHRSESFVALLCISNSAYVEDAATDGHLTVTQGSTTAPCIRHRKKLMHTSYEKLYV